MKPKKQAFLTGCALLFSLAIPTLGYVYLGSLVAFLFLLGTLADSFCGCLFRQGRHTLPSEFPTG